MNVRAFIYTNFNPVLTMASRSEASFPWYRFPFGLSTRARGQHNHVVSRPTTTTTTHVASFVSSVGLRVTFRFLTFGILRRVC